MVPVRSTYRLQLHRDFPFDHARAIVPYLARLGVSHLYLSPITAARAGSMHGYDVIDYDSINPELGGMPGFMRLAAAARASGLGIVLDIVPNHMSASTENPWWCDVLRHGARSRHAESFDIDWSRGEGGLTDKVLLPILASSYNEALDSGDLKLDYEPGAGRFVIRYFQNTLPLSPESEAGLWREASGHEEALEAGPQQGAQTHTAPHRGTPPHTPSHGMAQGRPRAARTVQAAAHSLPGSDAQHALPNAQLESILKAHTVPADAGAQGNESRARLHRLLEAQHYRLAFWQVARDLINWRRFFEINDLVGVCVERRAVFEATHALVFQLYQDGLIDGVRVDHIDGLAFPGEYCQRLRDRLDALEPAHRRATGRAAPGRAWIVVEKILGATEALPAGWPVDGTTGYDFMNQVMRVLVDEQGEEPLDRLWRTHSGRKESFDLEEQAARAQILEENLHSESARAINSLVTLAGTEPGMREVTRGALERACRALLLALRVYRVYGEDQHSDGPHNAPLRQALERARGALGPADHAVLDQLGCWLGGAPAALAADSDTRRTDVAHAAARVAQLAAPLAAKAVEDTAFYRYGRLLALNEVGGNPGRFSMTPDGFHQAMSARRRCWPGTVNATATHDHKRGEDLRARLAVLSEACPLWARTVQDWHVRAAPYRTVFGSGPAPDPGDEYMLFQMLVGSWPLGLHPLDREGVGAWLARLVDWNIKALREAKRHSSWLAPATAYETACTRYLEALGHAQGSAFGVGDVAHLAAALEVPGALNGLTQAFLRMTAPGIPDLYQGTERWDFSLVDPDNRGAVDYPLRAAARMDAVDWAELLRNWRDGAIKQALIEHVLAARNDQEALFSRGDYRALVTAGSRSRHALAFGRATASQSALCIASRLSFGLVDAVPRIAAPLWGDTHVVLPSHAPAVWRDLLTGRSSRAQEGRLALGEVLSDLPVALLVAESA